MGKGKRLKEQRAAERAVVRPREVVRHAYPPMPAPGPWLPRWPHSCEALRQLAADREAARQALLDVECDIVQEVARERADGANWSEIGGALGVSRQGARQRFGLDE